MTFDEWWGKFGHNIFMECGALSAAKAAWDVALSKRAGDGVTVTVRELRYFSSFGCQHEPSCDTIDYGALCNSCWIRRWAQEKLKLLSYTPPQPESENAPQTFGTGACQSCGKETSNMVYYCEDCE